MSELLGSAHPAYKHPTTACTDTHTWRKTSGPSTHHNNSHYDERWRERQGQRSDVPQTPLLSSSSRHPFKDDTTNASPRFPSPPSASFESTSNILNRPGHVFWHASPSPSQQMRQRDFQKYLSSNASPIQPLGTQAFRDELLRQGSAKKNPNHVQMGNDDHEKINKPILVNLCDHDVPMKRRDSAGSSSLSSTNTSSSRKFSRRISRRSMLTSGEFSLTSNGTSGDGVHRLLADLNEHLKSHATDMIEVEARVSKESTLQTDLSGALDQNESLAKELDRIFSSQDEILPEDDQEGRRKSKESSLVDVADAPIDASPSVSRVWSRIKSSPAEMEASPRSIKKSLQMTKVNSTKDCFEPKDKRQRISIAMSASAVRAGKNEQYTIAATKPPIRTSPRKRAALAEIKTVQAPALPLGKFVQDDCKGKEAKTRSSASPPKKWATLRTPRIGLSRHSTGSAQSHMTSLGSVNPAAPFKKPSRAPSNAAKATQQPPRVPSKGGDSRICVSSNDDYEAQETNGIFRSSRLAQQEEGKKSEIADDDISFDTSMDEDLLCIALDKVEATQELLRISQLPQKTETIREDVMMQKEPSDDLGDESFEFNSSDNEAMLSVMDAGGW